MSSAVIPGSFDPITNGHINIIKRVATMFDSVTVAVLINRDKQSLFTLEDRLRLIKETTKDCPNVSTAKFEGLLVDFVNTNNIDLIVRGLRGSADLEYELQMARMNREIGNVETIFLPADPIYAHVSSSIVKQVAKLQGNITGLVPAIVEAELRTMFEQRGLRGEP